MADRSKIRAAIERVAKTAFDQGVAQGRRNMAALQLRTQEHNSAMRDFLAALREAEFEELNEVAGLVHAAIEASSEPWTIDRLNHVWAKLHELANRKEASNAKKEG